VPVEQEQGDRALHKEDSELSRALDFLDAWLLPEPDVEGSPPPPEADARPAPVADTTAALERVDEPALQAPEAHDSRVARWRIPRGLLYWFGVGVTAGAAWRLTSSLYDMAIAALAASAALIGLELLLRAFDPRLARRLGFARPQRGAMFYGAGAALGLGTGLAVTHIL
jgi:hypothetical protein